ncbi:MAG: hypothetical protein KDB26_02895 [Microthrixaceae bacterium]|nr:hypothetical protein [Microthrixaceae bacterium]
MSRDTSDAPGPDGSSESAEVSEVDRHDFRRVDVMNAAFRVVTARIASADPASAGLLALNWIDASEVAKQADLPVEVFDELWPDPDPESGLSGFELFLWETFQSSSLETIKQHTTDALDLYQSNLEDLLRTGAIGEPFDADRMAPHLIALAVSCYSQHHRRDYDSYVDEVADLCSYVLYQFGLKMKEPLTARHLALNIAAVIEGPWIRAIAGVNEPNPVRNLAITPGSERQNWTLDAIGVWAVFHTMTEPIN